MIRLKINQIGNSVGVILPKEALSKLKVAKGDELFLVESDGGYLLTSYDPEFEEALRFADEGARKYRNALHELAK